MTADEIKVNYSRIEYLSSEKTWCLLEDYFPLCIEVKGSDDTVCLDNGAPMSNTEFWEAQIRDGHLFRRQASNLPWVRGPEIRLV